VKPTIRVATWLGLVVAAYFLATPLVSAQDDDACAAQADACRERASGSSEGCTNACDSYNSVDAYSRCLDRCTAREQRESDRCDKAEIDCKKRPRPSSTTKSSSSALFGSRAQGQDGCYFGECPTGDSSPSPSPPPKRPNPAPDPQPNPQPTTQQFVPTNVCQTQTFWCLMNQFGPPNFSCWCRNFNGYIVNGITVPLK
jgi:hypothetical protein